MLAVAIICSTNAAVVVVVVVDTFIHDQIIDVILGAEPWFKLSCRDDSLARGADVDDSDSDCAGYLAVGSLERAIAFLADFTN